jgi:hypothetical protein
MKEMETREDVKDTSVNERSSSHLVSVGPDRIKAFSDGVFAIALTLLILQVRVPSPSEITREADLQTFLLQQGTTTTIMKSPTSRSMLTSRRSASSIIKSRRVLRTSRKRSCSSARLRLRPTRASSI